jgi:hypothetical protein
VATERREVWLDGEAFELAKRSAALCRKGASEWLDRAVRVTAEGAANKRWLARRQYGEDFWREYSPPRRARPSGGGRVRVRVRLAPDMYELAQAEAGREGESLTVWLSETVREKARMEERMRALVKRERELWGGWHPNDASEPMKDLARAVAVPGDRRGR